MRQIFGYIFSSIEETVRELDEREQSLLAREQQLEEALSEVESLLEDIEATDPASEYDTVPTYVSEGSRFVSANSLAPRDALVLRTLEKLSYEDAGGQYVVSVPNKEIASSASTEFDPITTGSLSAALSRLSSKGLIEVVALSGRGYPRNIYLKARLRNESPH